MSYDEWDAMRDRETVKNNGESGVSYANEAWRESDVEEAQKRLDANGR
ncbi:MAG: hypothetical protein LBR81_01990 [Prevotellaceae bacterium]|jgi:hypothetical protein|nr:hypothetical protein [Prevotellaceae bacterium]